MPDVPRLLQEPLAFPVPRLLQKPPVPSPSQGRLLLILHFGDRLRRVGIPSLIGQTNLSRPVFFQLAPLWPGCREKPVPRKPHGETRRYKLASGSSHLQGAETVIAMVGAVCKPPRSRSQAHFASISSVIEGCPKSSDSREKWTPCWHRCLCQCREQVGRGGPVAPLSP